MSSNENDFIDLIKTGLSHFTDASHQNWLHNEVATYGQAISG